MEESDFIEDFDYYDPTDDERKMATFAHLGALAGCVVPMGNIILPLVIWLTKKDESEFIDMQAKEALNFQLTMTILFFGAAILCLILIGIPMLIGLVIFYFVASIIAAIRANEGVHYDYPLNFRIIP